MRKQQPIQYKFSKGEITPRLQGDTSSDTYREGLAECLNMVPLAQGPIVSRTGSIYLGNAIDNDNIRLIPFTILRAGNFVLELGPLTLRIFNENGLVDIGGQEHVADNVFSNEFDFWTNVSGDNNAVITFDHNQQSVSLLNVKINDDAAIEQNLFPFSAANLNTLHEIKLVYSGDGDLQIKLGTTQGASDILDQTVTVDGDIVFSFTPTVSTIWLTLTNTSGADTTAIIVSPSVTRAVKTTTIATPYAAEDLDEIQYAEISSLKALVLVHSKHPPQQVVLTLPTDFVFSVIVFNVPPASWVGENFPNVVASFQGRLWMARTPDTLTGIWASQSGDYYNFDQGTSLANESIFIEIAFSGQIEWMRGQKDLLLGTDFGEFRINAGDAVITPTNIDVRQQSAYGAANLIQSQNIGDQVLFVSPDNRKVRALTFDTFQQGWYSPDLTWTAQHLTFDGVKEIHFARDPETLVGCLLKNGSIAVCTYDRSEKTLGWARFVYGQSLIKSMCITNGAKGSVITSAVKQDNGQMVVVRSAEDRASIPNMDSAVSRSVEAGGIVTGLEHLEGLVVGIKVDGAIHPSRTVTGGQVTLDYTGNIALIGLTFTARAKTLPLDMSSKIGTGVHERKHLAKIYIRTEGSYLPKVNGIRPPTRSPLTPMNEVDNPVIEDIQATDLGRTSRAQITVEQDLPLPLTVLSIFGIEGQDSI